MPEQRHDPLPKQACGARFTDAAPLFAALGDPTRLRIVDRLSGGPLSIIRLTEGTDVTRQAITKHLSVLEQAGLVSSDRDGRERMWTLQTQRLTEARRHLRQISEQWDAALNRLRAYLETDAR
jgi:DNA-binding transcriptional ArsR family regulator